MSILHSTGSVEWYTPEWIIQLVKWVFKGPIWLDPASCPEANKVVRARRFYTSDPSSPFGGGLTRPWRARTLFCNPPYTATIAERKVKLAERFVARAINEHRADQYREGILLLNSTPERQWYQNLSRYAWTCLLAKRLHYWRIGDNGEREVASQPTHGNAVFYLGHRPARFARIFGKHGAIVPPLVELDVIRLGMLHAFGGSERRVKRLPMSALPGNAVALSEQGQAEPSRRASGVPNPQEVATRGVVRRGARTT